MGKVVQLPKTKKQTDDGAGLRTAVYVRVSTDEQAKSGHSLEAQEAECRRFAELQGWRIVDVYRDDGYSGGKENRPHLNRLVADIRAGLIDRVLVWKIDRLSRHLPHLVHLVWEFFPEHDVVVRSVTEPFETETSAGRLHVSQLASFANYEREIIVERTTSCRYEAAKKGAWQTIAPYGYKLAGEKRNRRLEVDPPTAEVVRRIFREALEGHSLRSIAMGLQRDGYRTRRGLPWRPGEVKLILQNEAYLGHTIFGRQKVIRGKRVNQPPDSWIRVENTHEPIIDEETFRAVQAKRITVYAARRVKGKFNKFLLTGVIRCGVCGGAMVPVTTKWYEGYRCRRQMDTGRFVCGMKYLRRCTVEEGFIEDLLSRLEAVRQQTAGFEDSISEVACSLPDDLAEELRRTERNLSENRRKSKLWADAFEQSGDLSGLEELRIRLRELDEERRALLDRKQALEAQGAALRAQRRLAKEFFDSLPGNTVHEAFEAMSQEERKRLIRQLVSQIRAYPDYRLEVDILL